MTDRKSYGQFCGLARSLDRIGDRWTLLIVRELLLGDRTFRELEGALRTVSPSLLTERLARLVDDGLVERNDAPPRSRNVEYGLTDAGRELEQVVLGLIRWGRRWMLGGPGDDHVDERWAPLALKALLDGRCPGRGRVHLDVDGVEVTISVGDGRRSVVGGHIGAPDATVAAPLPVVLAVAGEAVGLADSSAEISGDHVLAAELLGPGDGDSL